MEDNQNNEKVTSDISSTLDRKLTALTALSLAMAVLSLAYFFNGPLNRVENAAAAASATNTIVVEKKVLVDQENYRPGHILVKFKPGVSSEDKQKEYKKIGAEVKKEIKGIEVALLKVPEQAEEALAKALNNNPRVEFAEVDILTEPTNIPNDPQFSSQWMHAAISSAGAWSLASSSNSVIVAVGDSGFEVNHEDLAGNMISPGYNTVDGSSDVSPKSDHGTKVAGVSAATGNNGLGVAGVSYNSKILPIRITNRDDALAYSSDIAEAITYAADNGAKVVNISYAAYSVSSVKSAATYLRSNGGVVTMAGGNNNTDPGYAAVPDILIIAALNSDKTRASYSNFGNYIDFAMPGSGILTTNIGGGYASVSGTSFASPATAGAVAMMFSANPGLTFEDIEQIFIDTAEDLGATGWDQYYGWGIIDLEAAVAAALNFEGPAPDTTPPSVSISSPSNGATVSGVINVAVSANDNVEVSRVELLKNGVVVGNDTNAPYDFSWNTLNDNNGNHTLEARAYDSSNNSALSSSVEVTVFNELDTTAPTVTITSPTGGTILPTKGNETITVTATDNVGVTQIVIKLDDSVEGSCSDVTSCSTAINLRKVSSGLHTITAEAYDARGNTNTATISVTVGDSGGGDEGPGNSGGKGKKK